MPPYLHYHDAADEEESCPQPSALPAALAACCPSVKHTHSDAHPRFHSHPPLPPHPLSRLHRAGVKPATSPGPAGNSPGSSPKAAGCSPVEDGPAARSPASIPMAGMVSTLPASRAYVRHEGAEQHSSSPPHMHAQQQDVCQDGGDLVQQQQQEASCEQATGLQTQQQGDSCPLQQRRTHASMDQAAQADASQSDWQGGSGSDSESSDASERQSGLAVGNDELLEHEPEAMMLHHELGQQPGPSHYANMHKCLGTGQFGGQTTYPALSETQQQQVSSCNEMVQPSSLQGIPQQLRRLQQAPLYQQHAVHSSSMVVSQEHVDRQPSKLRALYRRKCDPEQQQQQQQQVLHQEDSVPASCYKQPSMKTVPQPEPAPTLPTKVGYPPIHMLACICHWKL